MKKPLVKSLSVITVNVPLERPIVASLGTFEYWPYMLIEISLSDGTIGKGYIGPYLVNYTQTIALAMKELFKNFQNREIAPYQFYNEGMNHLSLLGRSGIALYALAGLDIAFWDASSKICNEPLCVHLGGSVDKVKAYNSSGLWLDHPQTLYDEALSLISEGNFDAVKVRLGRKKLDEDLKAIENVKKGIGVNSELLCDFNQCLSLPQAIHRLNDLDEQGLYWFEEPIKYYEFEGYKELRKRMKTPIILGENSYGKGSVQSIIPLTNGGGMRLTISKYYLPSGKSISEVGVTPDILVEEEGDDFLINTEKDNQLNYAIKLFNS